MPYSSSSAAVTASIRTPSSSGCRIFAAHTRVFMFDCVLLSAVITAPRHAQNADSCFCSSRFSFWPSLWA